MNTLGVQKIGIAGLGLIGGSIARTLHSKGYEITAFDRNEESLEKAKGLGIISQKSSDNLSCLYECQVVFLCLPVDGITQTAVELSPYGGLISDVGSTKTELLNEIRQAGVKRFIGGHPMAGSERVGFGASSEHLLENAIYVLCPDENTDQADLCLLQGLVDEMGAIPLVMNEEKHDRAVAIISHLPHVVAASLCGLVDNQKDNMLNALCAGGFKDITRIASSSPELWTEITLSSKALLPVLDEYIEELTQWRRGIAAEDKEEVRGRYAKGSGFRNQIAVSGRGILQALPEIRLEVSDKPGVIASITSILGDKGINIQNLNIQNNRAYEGGIMRLTLLDPHDKPLAISLLRDQGFVCFE